MSRPPVRARIGCRDCGAPIVFARLDTGSLIPLDPAPSPGGNVAVLKIGQQLHGHVISRDKPLLEDGRWLRMMPHAATCQAKPTPIPPADKTLW